MTRDLDFDSLANLESEDFEDAEHIAQVREEVFIQTERAFSLGRSNRRLVSVLGGLVLYAAGLLTAWVIGVLAPAERESNPVEKSKKQVVLSDTQDLVPGEIRKLALRATGLERARLLRLAGDRYLLEHDDKLGALHCYQLLLRLEKESVSLVDAEATWLWKAVAASL